MKLPAVPDRPDRVNDVSRLQQESRSDARLTGWASHTGTHFRQGPGGSSGDSDFAPLSSGLQSSRPMPLGKGAPLDHERLTPRESEVLTYLSKGFTIKEIASLMGIKWFTVNDHIKSIYKKLNVSSRAEAAVLATKQGLV